MGDDERTTSRIFLPMVRGSAVIPFIRFLEQAGAPVERYLAETKLSPCIVQRPEDLLSLHQALAFLDRAAAGERLEDLGLRVGCRTEITDLGAIGRVIQRSVTLLDALTTVAATVNLYNSGDRIWLLPDTDPVLFCHAFVCSGAPGAHQGNLFTIMVMIKVVRLAAGPAWWPREIRLPNAESARRRYYEALLPTDVVFHDLEAFAIVLDRPLLVRSMAATARPKASPGDDTALLRLTAPAPDLGGSVRQAIGELLHGGYPDIRLVADMAGLSVRTFQRLLAGEGSSYSRLVEQARFETAVRLLGDDRVKLVDIAFDLGYTDAGNFSRAFKQWAGVSPREYRRSANRGH